MLATIRQTLFLALFGYVLIAQGADWSLKINLTEFNGQPVDSATLDVTPAGSADSQPRAVRPGDTFPLGSTLAAPSPAGAAEQQRQRSASVLPGSRLKISASSGRGEEYTQ